MKVIKFTILTIGILLLVFGIVSRFTYQYQSTNDFLIQPAGNYFY